ncbi:ABC transporter ATP-binding protein [Planctobacterium marinum]|uniref:ABC transporter domain-containing protein n=1 Tax=Planctobacterium marinum TaxID=1631968 RepID=A0AA48HNT1_9ALTE|nr:hypothetical protein MACH26_07550 [Planctobacterium marinum]
MHIQIRHLCKTYKTVKAVNDLSFDIKSGEIFAILGPNGAGKSSTLRMLVGLTTVDKGEILINKGEQQITRLSSEQFGYLPEERGLYQETSIHKTLHYIAALKGMKKSDAEQQIQFWLEEFDLLDRQKEPLKALSKGNQQKIQLLSSIIHRPELVILDEPFSGLDPVNQEKVIQFLTTLKEQGTTILLSAHQMSLVEKLADRLLLMAKGKAVLYGDMKQIRAASTLGSTLSLELAECPAEEVLTTAQQQLSDVLAITPVDQFNIQLRLSGGCHIPTLLKQVMAMLPVANLQLQQPGLHEIYLHALSDSNAEKEHQDD